MTRRGTRSNASHSTTAAGDVAAAVAALAASSPLPQTAGLRVGHPQRHSRGVWSPAAPRPVVKATDTAATDFDAAGSPTGDSVEGQADNVTHTNAPGARLGEDEAIDALLGNELAAALTNPSSSGDGGAAVASYLQCCDASEAFFQLPPPPPVRRFAKVPAAVSSAEDGATGAADVRRLAIMPPTTQPPATAPPMVGMAETTCLDSVDAFLSELIEAPEAGETAHQAGAKVPGPDDRTATPHMPRLSAAAQQLVALQQFVAAPQRRQPMPSPWPCHPPPMLQAGQQPSVRVGAVYAASAPRPPHPSFPIVRRLGSSLPVGAKGLSSAATSTRNACVGVTPVPQAPHEVPSPLRAAAATILATATTTATGTTEPVQSQQAGSRRARRDGLPADVAALAAQNCSLRREVVRLRAQHDSMRVALDNALRNAYRCAHETRVAVEHQAAAYEEVRLYRNRFGVL